MAAVATIINKGGTDKVLILGIRTFVVYPFTAPGWTDLRVGFFSSVTDDTVDDPASPITGLAETIAQPGLTVSDRLWIGLKTNDDLFPKNAGVTFIGFTNCTMLPGGEINGDSFLASSDAGTGTSNTNFWRPGNSTLPVTEGIWDGGTPKAGIGIPMHFAQDTTGAGGYAVLHMLRLQRPGSGASSPITVTIKTGTNMDVLFTNTPTLNLLQTNLQNFPTTVSQMGPAVLSKVPDALFCYWPFFNSRLRLHAVGFLSATS
jgi:hypothetical protein